MTLIFLIGVLISVGDVKVCLANSCSDLFNKSGNSRSRVTFVTSGRRQAIKKRMDEDEKWRSYSEFHRSMMLNIQNYYRNTQTQWFDDHAGGLRLLMSGEAESYVLALNKINGAREDRMSVLFSKQVELLSYFRVTDDIRLWLESFFAQSLNFAASHYEVDQKWYPQVVSVFDHMIVKAKDKDTEDFVEFFSYPDVVEPLKNLIDQLQSTNNFMLGRQHLNPEWNME